MPSCSEDFAFRGLIHQVSDPTLPARLDAGGETVYVGFDPTAASLHMGNLLQLCSLRRLQLAGHRPIALAGSGTGLVGDPGGKTEERPLISPGPNSTPTSRASAPQLARFLDFSPGISVRRRRRRQRRLALRACRSSTSCGTSAGTPP